MASVAFLTLVGGGFTVCFLGARGLGALEAGTRFLVVAGTVATELTDNSLLSSIVETPAMAVSPNLLELISGAGCRILAAKSESVWSSSNRDEFFLLFCFCTGLEKGNSRFGGSIWLKVWLSMTGAVEGRG